MNRQGKWLTMLALWLLAMVAHAGTVTYVYTDPQGTPLAEANASGTIIATYDYAPYGQAVASMSGAPDGPGYTGHVNDPETGLVYMQARYYDPGGRFLSPDPVGPAPGNIFSFNRYTYANNNPVINTDPTGMASDGSSCDADCKQARRQAREDRYIRDFGGSVSGPPVVFNKKGGRGKGERGRTSSPSGTNRPGKKWRDDPNNPGWGWQKDPNGKKIYKPRPPYLPPLDNKFSSPFTAHYFNGSHNNPTPAQKTVVSGGAVVIVIVIILLSPVGG